MSFEVAKAPIARGVFEQYKKGRRSAIADALKSTGNSVDPPPACKLRGKPPRLDGEAKEKNELVKARARGSALARPRRARLRSCCGEKPAPADADAPFPP